MTTPIYDALLAEQTPQSSSDPRHASLVDTQEWVPDWPPVATVHGREREVS